MKRGRWFGSIPVASEYIELEEYIRLWRAVLDQALEDVLTPEDSYEGRAAKFRAEVWLRGNTRDFYDVCLLADLNPFATKQRIQEILNATKPPA